MKEWRRVVGVRMRDVQFRIVGVAVIVVRVVGNVGKEVVEIVMITMIEIVMITIIEIVAIRTVITITFTITSTTIFTTTTIITLTTTLMTKQTTLHSPIPHYKTHPSPKLPLPPPQTLLSPI